MSTSDSNATIIRNARLVNEGSIREADLLIHSGRIKKIGGAIDADGADEIDANGRYLLPGIIDDQVHFREPGLTHKACIRTESAAAVAGGVTSFMDMPNVKPASLTQELLEARYVLAASESACNYSFYMGASNDNLEEVLRTDPRRVCGIKIFMGSSTGNMLVDEEAVLEGIFSRAHTLVAVHCEDEARIRARTAAYQAKYGEAIPIACHPEIRDEEACLLSSSQAVKLARKHGTRLHILHISTEEELALFENSTPLADKRITAEVCVHHLWFDASGYEILGTKIKCNPAIKAAHHKAALRRALLDNRLDVIATDHAPHTAKEKSGDYMHAPSGLPLVQHSLNLMLALRDEGAISLERIVEKMCHAPAIAFGLRDRGYIREGFYADLALLDIETQWTVSSENLLYRCAWSPLEGQRFKGRVTDTWVNGRRVFSVGKTIEPGHGMRLEFDR